ncbi:BCCT family transporter [Lolliginicoccus suaedae]|uniref:BCCT family transporter n=1 Tax=Lolliginicoccus suaedae TaxID=2605429 RepID=UPI0011EC6A1B|nr:BCCT family transporter [Lolliginicoccus suaedae]
MLRKMHDRLGLQTDPTIFFVSGGLVLGFVAVAIAFTDFIDSVFTAARDWLLTSLGWFYILGVTSFLIFLIWIALSKFGHVRLGGADEKPEFGTATWFAMLFAAGIGTILMFWGVAEPINHYANPPRADVEPESLAAMEEAMGFTLYHFGLHTWTIFCLPALAFSYFVYKRGLPMRVSSIFYPLLGERIHQWPGKAIDILAVIGTLFGVATSIGLGTLQINAGLNSLFGVPMGKPAQVILIAIITLIAIGSVMLGLDKGIKRLSNINITMAVGLLIFIFLTGSTLYLAKGIIETTGTYLEWLVPLAFWTDASNVNPGWQGNWTVFYWAWTITWAPFVGIFIARISKGRTIREFVGGVLALPTAFSIVWFSIFGLSSFDIERNQEGTLVQEVVEENDIPGALFAFLENFPLTTLIASISVLIVVIFFTTSSDSASLVVDMLCTGESEAGPVRQRVFWAALEGVVGATLLAAAAGTNGLDALQQVITVIGLPFFLIGFVMIYSLVKALNEDHVSTGSPVRERKHANLN